MYRNTPLSYEQVMTSQQTQPQQTQQPPHLPYEYQPHVPNMSGQYSSNYQPCGLITEPIGRAVQTNSLSDNAPNEPDYGLGPNVCPTYNVYLPSTVNYAGPQGGDTSMQFGHHDTSMGQPIIGESDTLHSNKDSEQIDLVKSNDVLVQMRETDLISKLDQEENETTATPTNGKPPKQRVRETWDTKIDFLLAVIGFAVDLGNIWRFPFICYRNGGGAFLIPYLVMYIFGGLPLFYLELALGQFQRSGCLTVWKRICPLFSGIGFGICIIASYTAWYYNTIMAWALFYLIDAMKPHLPWDGCKNWWNTNSCVSVYDRMANIPHYMNLSGEIYTNSGFISNISVYSSTEEYFYRRVLQIQYATGYDYVGPIRWEIALCLMVIFTIVYFSLWKGVKSSGKAVWVTATLPYVILSILLVRGLTLKGSLTGIQYYLTPKFSSLLQVSVWSDAASQIFFSLGPGFGVLLALSSYNKFHNNCYRDAMITSFINCATSFVSGFVVFSVLGYMCTRMGKSMEEVANEGPGLVFIAYPEAIATLTGSTFWAIIFMLMLITLGLDSTFGGLEAIITAIIDRVPALTGRREIFVLAVIIYCFVGALATTTCGGYLVLNMLDRHGAPISILFIVFCECVALCWFYGTKRFCRDVKTMLGFTPGIFWQICWAYISPLFLFCIFIANVVSYETQSVTVLGVTYEPTAWVIALSWMIVFSSPIFIPILMIYQMVKAKGSFKDRLKFLITPEDRPIYDDQMFKLNENNKWVPHRPDEPEEEEEDKQTKTLDEV